MIETTVMVIMMRTTTMMITLMRELQHPYTPGAIVKY